MLTATFSGRNEVPPNKSPYHGTGVFTLTGSSLAYSIALDEELLPLSAGIFGPARHHIGSQHVVSNLEITLGVLIPPAACRDSLVREAKYCTQAPARSPTSRFRS